MSGKKGRRRENGRPRDAAEGKAGDGVAGLTQMVCALGKWKATGGRSVGRRGAGEREAVAGGAVAGRD